MLCARSDSWAYGNTWLTMANVPVIAPATGTVKFSRTLLQSNAVIAIGDAPVVDFSMGMMPGLNFSGNAYWSTQPKGAVFQWKGVSFESLAEVL